MAATPRTHHILALDDRFLAWLLDRLLVSAKPTKQTRQNRAT
ncbi:hypothetical protein SAMN05443574_11772 [Haloarcula vallismortis]|uniref:Uncharacterized protein n=1 Tax=Haloarcula vallismortis TaxID=28442 RepID=A0A1H2ZQ32_HALVA|nr:hypothetical protein [Haloarcula vallismortis]SDX18964.1 hypothetical protein SAMN05443574_11772 [Haloarcula vallismortis]